MTIASEPAEMRQRLRFITIVPPVVCVFALLMPFHSPVHAESPPTPTVLRGTVPPPACPPGSYVAADYRCVLPQAYGYGENQPGYGYSPDDWYGPGIFVGPVHRFLRARRHVSLHRFRGFRVFPAFHAAGGFRPGAGDGFVRSGGFGR